MKKNYTLIYLTVVLFGFILICNIVSATGMTITLNPGWNVVSTPAILSGIEFSNSGNGISFSTLDDGQWVSMIPNATNIKPLEGFLVRNLNNYNVTMRLTYKDTSPAEDMLQPKSVKGGWNLLGITTINNPFYTISPSLSLDFTKNNSTNFRNAINTNYLAKNGTVETPEYGEAYGIYLSSNRSYAGSNNKRFADGMLSNTQDYSGIIKVTPGSYNVPLLKGQIHVDEEVFFKNEGFYLEISGANANEDIAGYAAGGIIYDLIVKVGTCTKHIDKSKYTSQTDDIGYKKLYIPLFEDCNYIPAGTYNISVLLGINSEYAINFNTGMTITMNPINTNSFNGIYIEGELSPAIIEVSHSNLPDLVVTELSDPHANIQIESGSSDFLLWSGILHTNESGVVVSVLIGLDESITYYPMRNYMYIDTYVNGNLINSGQYLYNFIKNEIPLEQNTDVLLEFRGNPTRFYSGATFVPRIIINKIIKKDIHYITQYCNYYRGECKEFILGNFMFHGGLFNVDGIKVGCTPEEQIACMSSSNYSNCMDECGGYYYWPSSNQRCTAEELANCILSDEYDVCIGNCSSN